MEDDKEYYQKALDSFINDIFTRYPVGIDLATGIANEDLKAVEYSKKIYKEFVKSLVTSKFMDRSDVIRHDDEILAIFTKAFLKRVNKALKLKEK